MLGRGGVIEERVFFTFFRNALLQDWWCIMRVGCDKRCDGTGTGGDVFLWQLLGVGQSSLVVVGQSPPIRCTPDNVCSAGRRREFYVHRKPGGVSPFHPHRPLDGSTRFPLTTTQRPSNYFRRKFCADSYTCYWFDRFQIVLSGSSPGDGNPARLSRRAGGLEKKITLPSEDITCGICCTPNGQVEFGSSANGYTCS